MKKQKKKITKGEIKKKQILKNASYRSRIEERLLQKKEALVYSTKKYYEALMKTATDKVQEKYTKKLCRRLAKIEKIYESRKNRQIKVKVYKKEVKAKQPTEAKIKQKAYSEICKYAKLARSDTNGMVKQIDTGKWVKRNECVGGHIYPKRNYSMLAFELLNIRPISPRGNNKQMDSVGDWIDKTPLTTDQKQWLKMMSEDKELKNQIRDREYYQYQYDTYKRLNDAILGIIG